MMRMRTKGSSPAFATVTEGEEKAGQWEVRPGGMLVQKRDPDSAAAIAAAVPVPTIRVKVKHGAVYHEIYLSSQASFGELKKLVGEKTGLHHLDQKIVFKDKERDSAAYIDTAGVRDGSKLVVTEDPTAQARRILEARRTAKAEKASKTLAAIVTNVDKLAAKVLQLEAILNKGKRVADDDLQNLIEQLMNQLLKLDGVPADGDIKQQIGMQVRRVQKYVEKLDMLKIKNATHKEQSPQPPPPQQPQPPPPQNKRPPPQSQRHRPSEQQQPRHQNQAEQQPQPHQPVVSTDWELFDSLFSSSSTSMVPVAPAPSRATATSGPAQRFDWELF